MILVPPKLKESFNSEGITSSVWINGNRKIGLIVFVDVGIIQVDFIDLIADTNGNFGTH